MGGLSILLPLLRSPLLRATDPREIDSIEEHRQLGAVELGTEGVLIHFRDPEPTLLETLVVEDEAAAVPAEHLHGKYSLIPVGIGESSGSEMEPRGA